MGLPLFIIILWVVDYLYFKIKYTKPDGPPVWYFFPFFGVAPFFCLPRPLFKIVWNWYLIHFPDVIICRFFLCPVAFAKNSAVRDVQLSASCLSRAANGFEKTMGYVMIGKPFWYVFDHNAEYCDWRFGRKMNLRALNVLPKEEKFARIADVADRFLSTIEGQKGRLWHYENDLNFAKIQETCNVNLGETFDNNDIEVFIEVVRTFSIHLGLAMLICSLPLQILLMIEPFVSKKYRISVAKRIYAKLTSAIIGERNRKIDKPADFVEAVLSVQEPESALEFIRNIGLFNMMASTHTTQHSTMAALSFIALDERVQQKVHEELDRVVGCSPLNHNHLAELHYLKASVQEAYRMSPPIPTVLRWTTAPARVADCTVQSDLRVATFIVTETMNHERFPKPDDFIPERYISDAGIFESCNVFNPFSRGRRMCPGADIANLSALIYCAKILQHFEIRAESPHVEVPRYSGAALTDFPTVPLRFIRRKGAPEISTVSFKCGLTAVFKDIVEREMAAE